jgi:hypothetical protein
MTWIDQLPSADAIRASNRRAAAAVQAAYRRLRCRGASIRLIAGQQPTASKELAP